MWRTLKLKLSGASVLYLVGFFTALKVALPSYIESSFLSQYVSAARLGLLFSIGSILSLILLYIAPRLLRLFGVYQVYLVSLLIQFFCFLTLGTFTNVWVIILAFVLDFALIPVIIFLTDILLESRSQNSQTGQIRGIYLTLVNLAWLGSPLLGSLLLVTDNYPAIFYASAAVLIILILVIGRCFQHFVDGEYKSFSLRTGFRSIWRNKNIRFVYLTALLLNFFYAWMVIYMPLHLRANGFAWSEIYQIFFVMLIPFVLIDIPAGRLADKRWGEKELLISGLVIAGLATGAVYFLAGQAIWLWMGVLFLTRVGAALIEVMNDTYFFKKVGYENTDVISFYRTVMPTAYIIAPVIASLILTWTGLGLGGLFVILSILLFMGLWPALRIKDTR